MKTTKYEIIWSQNVHIVKTLLVPVNKTFFNNFFKEYALIQEMSWRPLNMELIGHKMLISSQPFSLTGM